MKPNEQKRTYLLTCKFCGKQYKVDLYPSDVERYSNGTELVQNIFPYLCPDMRELLISGMCPDCFPK